MGLEAKRQKEIDKIVEKYKLELEALAVVKKSKFLTLFNFAQANRTSLIDKIKTAFWKNGTISWRFTPPKVESKLSDEEIIEALKKAGLQKYIRVKEEVNRELMLQDKPTLAGAAYTSTEEFVAKPKFLIANKNKTSTITEKVV